MKRVALPHKKPKKIKKNPIVLDSASSGDERIAYELIKLFAGALQALNGGCLPIPAHWKSCLQSTLKSQGKRGKPNSPEIKKQGIELAKGAIRKKMEANKAGMRPILKTLANAPDSKNIYRKIKPHMADAEIELLTENSRVRQQREYQKKLEQMRPYKQRLENGESVNALLIEAAPLKDATLFIALRRYAEHGIPLEGWPPKQQLTEREKAIAWMSDGMNRHIYAPDEYRTFILKDEYDKEIVKAVMPKKKNHE